MRPEVTVPPSTSRRAHALASGQTEDWVIRRTGHESSAMVARYRREAATAEELGLGWLKPMHDTIPEPARADTAASEVQSSGNCRKTEPAREDARGSDLN